MSAPLLLILRIILVVLLYGFITWVVFTLWQDLRLQNRRLNLNILPALTLLPADEFHHQSYSLRQPENIVGREPGCECSIDDRTISGRHARLTFRQEHWWVEDLDSTNGTFLNGEETSLPTVITEHDRLQFGRLSFLVRITPDFSTLPIPSNSTDSPAQAQE